MKKIIFLDIDGTLYSTKIGRIPDSAEKAIQLARKMDTRFFYVQADLFLKFKSI